MRLFRISAGKAQSNTKGRARQASIFFAVGDTIDFMLSAKRNRKAAKRFFKKALSSSHNQIPRVITVDKNPAYPPAINELKNDRILPKNVGIRQIKYLNNIIEQDHRSIKRIVNPMLGFQSFQSANKTLKGICLLYTSDAADDREV